MIKFPKTKPFIKLIEKHPLRYFLITLGILVALIVIGNKLRQPKKTETAKPPAKSVSIYSVDDVPKVNFSAFIEKSGVLQITSQSAGIVSKVYVKAGQHIRKGAPILALSNNFSGGNILTVSRQLAEKQNQLSESTYDIQKDLISRQREIANQSETNFEKMREITSQSISDTQSSINMNNEIISQLNTNIQNLSSDPVGNATLILSSKQLLSQFTSANNQLNSALRAAQYQSDSNNPPSKLADEQRNLTLRQLDMQEKSLDINREISRLQVTLARINESMMYPVAPSDGVIEQVFVKPGQQINPGTTLVVFSGSGENTIKATVYLPKEMAQNISKTVNTNFYIDGKTIVAEPSYISREATNGNLYSASFILPASDYGSLTDKSYIEASVPIGYPDTTSSVAYVPIDSIYQTENSAWLFLIKNGVAKSQEVKLGEVFGSFVRVEEGLSHGGEIIVDRNVIDGDFVTAK